MKILNSGLTESGSFPFIEMEFIEGPDLEELLADPHDPVFTLKEVLKIADHLANALAHCHMVGVKHGDVKSNNVKYNIHSGNYVLLDFGLAIMSDEQRRTSIRHAGAIEFMAPEQNTGAMYFQTDIYSYGIILYELLTGQVPFPLHDSGETSRNAVMIAHMEQGVPDLMEKRRANLPKGWSKEKREQETRVPQWLLQLISICLEKNPDKRYATGMALQEALFAGSLSTDQQPVSIDHLPQNVEVKDENPSLQATEPEVQQQGIIRVATPIFVLMIVAIACSLCAAAYFYTQRKTGPATETAIPKDSVVKPTTDTATHAQQAPHTTYQQRIQEADSLTKQAIKDDIKQDGQKAIDQQNQQDSTNNKPQDTTSHGGTDQQ